MRSPRCEGFTLIEMLVGLAVTGLVSAGLAGLLVESARTNRRQQMLAEVQSNARGCLSMIVQALRSAGWDPRLAGIPTVALDPDPTDGVDEIEIFADLDADGLIVSDGERVLIRHLNGRIEWRTSPTAPFVILGIDITNDADGDGVPEPMFVPLPNPDPTRIRVKITARSRTRDPVSRTYLRHTVATDVVLRASL